MQEVNQETLRHGDTLGCTYEPHDAVHRQPAAVLFHDPDEWTSQ
jgi:hypothetical protein